MRTKSTRITAGFGLLLTGLLSTSAALGAAAPTATCNGLDATIEVTSDQSEVVGTDGDDVIVADGRIGNVEGMDGDDTICAYGPHRVSGGPGDDLIITGPSTEAGSDTLVVEGDEGRDRIFGYTTRSGQGQSLSGGPQRDTIRAGGGPDLIFGGSGWDWLYGGPGDDQLHGGVGFDRLFGQQGDDLIAGEAGQDHAWGGLGDDVIHGSSAGRLRAADILGSDNVDLSFDLLNGGPGDDRLFGGLGNDSLSGGKGADILYANDGDRDENGDLVALPSIGVATLSRAPDAWGAVLRGGDGNDLLIGGNKSDLLLGGTGNDIIFGLEGPDKIRGGTGNDTIVGGTGADLLRGERGRDKIVVMGADSAGGGPGQDTCLLGSNTFEATLSCDETAAPGPGWNDLTALIEATLGI